MNIIGRQKRVDSKGEALNGSWAWITSLYDEKKVASMAESHVDYICPSFITMVI